MARGENEVNPTLKALLHEAQSDFWNAWERAKNFQHSGIRGEERETAVRQFLREKLPGAYGAVKGEAVDSKNTRSTQLDVVIYDQIRNGPLLAKSDQFLLPAEALLSVIEVKSVLTLDELKTCFEAAKHLRNLKPYNTSFVDARLNGAAAEDKNPRCFYCIFAYDTNLAPTDWAKKEWERVKKAAQDTECNPTFIDRILVLSRGLLIPEGTTCKVMATDQEVAFREWFLHLVNFLSRENPRRRPVDLQEYSSSSAGWWRIQ